MLDHVQSFCTVLGVLAMPQKTGISKENTTMGKIEQMKKRMDGRQYIC